MARVHMNAASLALGRRIVIEGRLADKDGTHAIVNPEYEFVDHQ